MSKSSSLAHVREEMEARRGRVKEEFEKRIREAERKAEHYRKRMDAEKKKRDAKIAKIEEGFGKRAAAILKKRLGEEDYKRFQEWLLRKKKEKIRKLETQIQHTENEDYQRQLAELRETSSEEHLIHYYFSNKNELEEELKRDTGLEV